MNYHDTLTKSPVEVAKEEMLAAVRELIQVAQGTNVMFTLDLQLFGLRLELWEEQWVSAGVLDREKLYKDTAAKVREMAANVRRAILANPGGAPPNIFKGN